MSLEPDAVDRVESAPCEVDPALVKLDPQQVAALTDARNDSLKLEGLKHAVQESIRSLHRKARLRDIAGISLAIWTLLLLWIIGDRTSSLHDLASIISTMLSLAVTTLAIWGFIAKWDEQVERKNELASKLNASITAYKKLYGAEHPDVGKLKSWRLGLADLDELKNHRLTELNQRCKQLGHQHVAMTYPNIGLRCGVCNREWRPEFGVQRKSLKRFFRSCENCGIPYDHQPARSGEEPPQHAHEE